MNYTTPPLLGYTHIFIYVYVCVYAKFLFASILPLEISRLVDKHFRVIYN